MTGFNLSAWAITHRPLVHYFMAMLVIIGVAVAYLTTLALSRGQASAAAADEAVPQTAEDLPTGAAITSEVLTR